MRLRKNILHFLDSILKDRLVFFIYWFYLFYLIFLFVYWSINLMKFSFVIPFFFVPFFFYWTLILPIFSGYLSLSSCKYLPNEPFYLPFTLFDLTVIIWACGYSCLRIILKSFGNVVEVRWGIYYTMIDVKKLLMTLRNEESSG